MIYLDSCALVKLVLPEAESPALEAFLDGHRGEWQVSSALARTEVRRALHHQEALPRRFSLATDMLARLSLVKVDEALFDAAGAIPKRALRSLDAIHLATAQKLGAALTAFVTYDKRLAVAAREQGLPVVTPS